MRKREFERLKKGQRVVVTGDQDGEKFANERGRIISVGMSGLGFQVGIEFDTWREGHDGQDSTNPEGGKEDACWFFYENDRKHFQIVREDHSTYLNGLLDTTGKSDVQAPSQIEEDTMDDGSVRPTFMTAWMADTAEVFMPTGDAFLSQEDAENSAETILRMQGTAGQIAIFELKSVKLARVHIHSDTP